MREILAICVLVVVAMSATSSSQPVPKGKGKEVVDIVEAPAVIQPAPPVEEVIIIGKSPITGDVGVIQIEPPLPPDCRGWALEATGFENLSVFYEVRPGGSRKMVICERPEHLWIGP